MRTDKMLPLFFSADAKQVGQYSRRHQTRDAQDKAREIYQSRRGKATRRIRAQERAAR